MGSYNVQANLLRMIKKKYRNTENKNKTKNRESLAIGQNKTISIIYPRSNPVSVNNFHIGQIDFFLFHR